MSLKRVLIVDDAMELGRLYQDALRTTYPGLPVTFVPSAEEAMLEATRFTFDLMIVDIRLPGMSGVDLLRKIRARQPGIKAIMITGLKIDEELRKKVENVHADKLLRKPLGVSQFLDAVQAVVEGGEPAAPEPEPARAKARAKTAPLPQPPAAPSMDVIVENKPGMGEALANLRGSLGALSAVLLDDNGRVAAIAGDWPEQGISEALIPSVMASLSASEKVSRTLHQAFPETAHAVRGQRYNLVFAAVGTYALMIFTKSETSSLRTALVFDEIQSAQRQFASILKEMGVIIDPAAVVAPPETPVSESAAPAADARWEATPSPATPAADAPTPAPEEPTADELPGLKALEEILGKPASGSKENLDADDFWDSLTASETKTVNNPDALTYDQALKLGLLPGEEENKK